MELLTDGRVPSETIILIDEIHDFLKLPAQLTSHGISCPYKIASTAGQVIGLSATFGGAQVKLDITKLFISSIFIEAPKQTAIRKLELTVTGKLDEVIIMKETSDKAIEKALDLPVIIFH